MSWARIDDNFYDHHKVVQLSMEAVGLWTVSLTWAHRNVTSNGVQGYVPASVAARFAGTKAKRSAAELVRVGLWETADGGYVIHDFGQYLSPSRERSTPGTPADLSEKRREAGRRGGKAAQAGRQASSKPCEQTEQVASPESEQPEQLLVSPVVGTSVLRTSVPTPVPVPTTSGVASPNAGQLMAEHIEACKARPPGNVVGQLAKHVGAMLAEGITPEHIREGLALFRLKPMHPSTLPSLVNEAMNRPAPRLTKVDERNTGWDELSRKLYAEQHPQTLEIAP